MERMFVDPETGAIHPESYYQRQNVDLATVIEVIRDGEQLGFIINPEDIPRMKVRSQPVFEMFKEFARDIVRKAQESKNEEEVEEYLEVGFMLSIMMLKNIKEMEEERNGESLH